MPATSTAAIKQRLDLLEHERALATGTALFNDAAYMADLEEEILATRYAYVGSAVVEIASLRAAIDGPLLG